MMKNKLIKQEKIKKNRIQEKFSEIRLECIYYIHRQKMTQNSQNGDTFQKNN